LKRWGLAVLAAAVMATALWADAAKHKGNQTMNQTGSVWVKDTDRTVPLRYRTTFKQELKPGEPGAALKQMRTVRFDGDEGLQGTSLSFFESAEGYFMAFLTDAKGVRYHLENAPGMEVEVRSLDPDDPVKAIVLSKTDTEDPRKMVIRRNTATGVWDVWDFQGYKIQLLNIDRKGEVEWVSFDSWAVPPMMVLFKWNREKQEFEGASAEEAVLSEGGWMDQEIPVYSYLFWENGQWLLQIGQERRFRFYRYEGEGLREVELPDPTSSRAYRLSSHDM
jgi:hypothetical protein